MTRLIVRGIIPYQGKYLLTRHKRAEYWCLPGGKIESGESIIEALERELVEELGVRPVVGQLLYIQQLFRQPKEQRVEFFFLINNAEAYQSVDITKTSHGPSELEDAGFRSLESARVLPEYLVSELPVLLQSYKPNELPQFRTSWQV